ncbi:MAG TPA: adenylate/guanylate cyclase domain-containing protein, partial [Candidatus Acidoferrum sp.]|nr:adenylate/guanylate cyclase domain-containing protein [Candidatus Acidoferrum sp.]
YSALWTHFAHPLWSLYQRRTLRMPVWEALQLTAGLALPPLLVSHVVGTHAAAAWFGASDTYTRVVVALWQLQPERGARQALVLAVAWLHGCIGFHYWLRLRSWYPRAVPVLYGVALLLPVLALLGFAQAGREVSLHAREPGWVEAVRRETGPQGADATATLGRISDGLLIGFGVALGATLAARGARRWVERRRGMIQITYPGGRRVAVPVGFTVLEASRLAGIPHASVCGGRGRCSTCRVRVMKGADRLPPPSPAELRVLRRVGAPEKVRLACQLRPTDDVSVIPLLPPQAWPEVGLSGSDTLTQKEQEVTVLFADLRGFTRIAERKLPFDVVFLLNKYFEAAGGSIKRAGGIANQFTGDGAMALFGVGAGPEDGCRHALAAADDMVRTVADLSQILAEELPAPLKIGIGIHTGSAVVGRMGYAETVYLTAVGDTVHVASRLQELTKEYDCQLVISEQVATRAKVDVSAFPRHELTVRNRVEPLAIRVIDEVSRILPAVPAGEA